MRIELTNTFPVPLKQGFDFLHEVDEWPDWYSGIMEIHEPDASWRKPGDTILVSYRVLGRHLDGSVVMKEMREYEMVRFVVLISGLPEVRQEYHYTSADEESFILKVIVETEEVTTFLGREVDPMLLPGIMERDLKESMVNLQEIFATGVPQPEWWS